MPVRTGVPFEILPPRFTGVPGTNVEDAVRHIPVLLSCSTDKVSDIRTVSSLSLVSTTILESSTLVTVPLTNLSATGRDLSTKVISIES